MSGSGGGNGGGGIDAPKDCRGISFVTDVNSPQEDQLAGLNVGQKLDVILSDGRVVLNRQDSGRLLGSVNWSFISRLIECLEGGFEYEATVRDVQGGLVKVHVFAK